MNIIQYRRMRERLLWCFFPQTTVVFN